MADRAQQIFDLTDNVYFDSKYRDNGDGGFSQRVWVDNIAGAGGGAAAVQPIDITLLTSATRNGTTVTTDQINENPYRRGVVLYLNVTGVTALQTVQINLQGKDPVSGNYFTLKQSTAIGVAGLVGLTLGSADAFGLPRVWRVQVVHSGLGNFAYSLGASLVP